MAVRTAFAARLLGLAVVAGGLAACGGADDHADVQSANAQAEAAKDPAAPLNATGVAPPATVAQPRAAAVKPASLSSREDALTTAPAPYEGDATAATALPPQTDDAAPAPKGNTAT